MSLIRARAGCSDALGRCLDRLAGFGRRDAGCIRYEIRRLDTDTALWWIHTMWETAEAAIDHLTQPHSAAFADALVALIQGDVGYSSFCEASGEVWAAA
jgi:quinol monooxygenase YgiN